MATLLSDSFIDLTIKSGLSLVSFPTRLPPKGERAANEIDIGFTNAPIIGELMERTTRDPNLPRWEVVDLSHLSKIAKERILNQYKIKKEDLVVPYGWVDWAFVTRGFWITPGCM